MNSDQAKKLDLPAIMARLGYYPVKETKNGAEKWYASPFRNEADPSFHTSYLGGKWIWNDFGDAGGTVIDFVMRHENYSSVKDALAFLRENHGRVGQRIINSRQSSFSFQQQPAAAVAAAPARELELVSAKPVRNSVIIRYLTEKRGINPDLIPIYLAEVRYKNLKSGKTFFAFGTKNVSDGYEIRAASDKFNFKSVIGPRDITVFKGLKPELKIADVFEGITDYLSLLTMMKTDHLNGDIIIMNSLSSYNKTLAFLQDQDYKSINLFLDNDKPGNEATKSFIDDLGPELVHDQASMFLPYVDLNDMLVPLRATKEGIASLKGPDSE